MRAAICKSLVELIKQKVDGSGYSEGFYGNNVSDRNLSFDQIPDFPYCTVTPGVGTREYQPSSFVWAFLDVYIRLHVEDEEDAQGKLELLIADIENLIDSNLELEYTITKASGDSSEFRTTDARINSISTDEGVLSPLGFGEISLRIRYQK